MELTLQYSEICKIPKIVIDGHHRVQFVDEKSLMPKGKFKYLHVVGDVVSVVKKGRMQNGERQAHKTVKTNESDICYMTFSDLSSELKNLKIYKKLVPVLKKVIGKYLDDDNLFPPEALDLLERDLTDINAHLAELNKKKEEKKARKADLAARRADIEAKKKARELRKQELLQKKLIREEKKAARLLKQQQREEKRRAKEQRQG